MRHGRRPDEVCLKLLTEKADGKIHIMTPNLGASSRPTSTSYLPVLPIWTKKRRRNFAIDSRMTERVNLVD